MELSLEKSIKQKLKNGLKIIMIKKNSNWAIQYGSIKMHIPFWKKILHFIRPPYMQDPSNGKIYSKYEPEGVYIKTTDDS
jgi:hypothetical protein